MFNYNEYVIETTKSVQLQGVCNQNNSRTLFIYNSRQIAFLFLLRANPRGGEEEEEVATTHHIRPTQALLPQERNERERHYGNHNSTHQVLQEHFLPVVQQEG